MSTSTEARPKASHYLTINKAERIFLCLVFLIATSPLGSATLTASEHQKAKTDVAQRSDK